jgi:putative DNA primase/helicase
MKSASVSFRRSGESGGGRENCRPYRQWSRWSAQRASRRAPRWSGVTDRYVRTEDLRGALSGQATTIIDALRIPWNSAGHNRHIKCPYPNHDDRHPSWRWDSTKERAFCTCTPKGDDALGVLRKVKGIDFAEAKLTAAEILDRTDLIRTAANGSEWPGNKTDGAGSPQRRHQKQHVIKTYYYHDEKGAVLFKVERWGPRKTFSQHPPDGNGGWKKGEGAMRGVRLVPYRLPHLVAAKAMANGTPWRVYILEGEKDVDNVVQRWGVTATTNPMGAGKWRPEFNRHFAGSDAVIVADNDETGRGHVAAAAAELATVASIVRAVELGGLDEHGDISDWIEAGGSHAQLEQLVASAQVFRHDAPRRSDQEAAGPLVVDPGAPLDIARLFLTKRHTVGQMRTLHHHRGAFYVWNGTSYPEAEEASLRAELYEFLDQCVSIGARDVRPFKPTMARVSQILDALKAASIVPASIEAPTWLDNVTHLASGDIIACGNGLLHLPTFDLLPHSPEFFTHNALEFAYERHAPEPAGWFRFLAELWPEDAQSIDTLQEIFGYALSSDTKQQKAFLIVGPKRSGKGTIARVLARLVGLSNTVAPTLAGLGMNFGLAPLIGKRIAIISDARLGARADQHAIAERLLSITGEDANTVDRKFLPAWTGQLQTRFVILSNELPRLADASGALASRFIVLLLTKSFYGREDPSLTDRLLRELPGILNWSIAGLQRLRDRGYFLQPSSAAEAVQDLEDLGSPIGAFVRDRCDVQSWLRVERHRLFQAWVDWCKVQGRDHPGTAADFGRNLRAAVPGLADTRPEIEGNRYRFYEGIGIR